MMARSLLPVSVAGLLLALLVTVSGCSTTPEVTGRAFHPEVLLAADGQLRYRIPEGWLDGSRDPQGAGHLIWLVRGDYGATIAVDPVHLDAQASTALAGNGLLEVAGLQLGLESATGANEITQQPELGTVNGKKVCSYAVRVGAGADVKRTMLVNAGGALYAVHALVTPKLGAEETAQVYALQSGFVAVMKR
jgi:hypothetical protein